MPILSPFIISQNKTISNKSLLETICNNVTNRNRKLKIMAKVLTFPRNEVCKF